MLTNSLDLVLVIRNLTFRDVFLCLFRRDDCFLSFLRGRSSTTDAVDQGLLDKDPFVVEMNRIFVVVAMNERSVKFLQGVDLVPERVVAPFIVVRDEHVSDAISADCFGMKGSACAQ